MCANVAKFSTGLGPVSSIEQRSWFTRWIFPFCPGQPGVARAYAPLSGDCGAKGHGCYARAGDPTSPCWCALIRSFWRLETPSLSKMLVR